MDGPRNDSQRMTFLGSTSVGGACPTLYRLADGRVVVQGEALTEPALVAQARAVLPGEAFVVVPAALGQFWPVVDA
jgi:hypothetical protein